MKFPPPPPLSGIFSSTKLKHKKNYIYWLVIHKAMVVHEWLGKILAEIDKNCPHCGLQSVELVEHRFFSCPLAQQGWWYAANIMWQLLAKSGNLGPRKSFSMMQCFFYQPLCKTLKRFNRIWSFWGVVSRGLFGTNGIIWCLMCCNGPLGKHVKSIGTPCRIMVGLSGNGFADLEKTPDIAYQNIVNDKWVKGLIVT